MAGPTAFASFKISDIIEEAWERCRLDVQQIGSGHSRTARRSLVYIINSWLVRMPTLFRLEVENVALAADAISVTPAANVVDLIQVMRVDADGNEDELVPLSASEYSGIINKTTEGSVPTHYWFDKTSKTVKVWGAPTEDITLNLWEIRRPFDQYNDDMDFNLPYEWLDGIVAELAARVGAKHPAVPLELVAHLERKAYSARDAALQAAIVHDQSVRLTPEGMVPVGSKSLYPGVSR